MTAPEPAVEPALPPEVALAFAPLHKRNFGIACGAAMALLVAASTGIHLIRSPEDGMPLVLLGNYFTGYRVSPAGIAVGAFWAGVTGFVAGWFLAFSRNLALAVFLFVIRARAELAAQRDFLDHL